MTFHHEDDASSSSPNLGSSLPGGGEIGYLRPPAVFKPSYNSANKSVKVEQCSVTETSESSNNNYDEIHDVAETATPSSHPSHMEDLRPPFTCNQSWKQSVEEPSVTETSASKSSKNHDAIKIHSIMDFQTSLPYAPFYQDVAASEGDSEYMKPPAVVNQKSHNNNKSVTFEHSSVSDTSESASNHNQIHDLAESTTTTYYASNPFHSMEDLRPPFACHQSWKPKVIMDDDKYKGFGYAEVVLKKTTNGLKVSNGFQLESPPVERRKWDYSHR